jgi:hypothetical protein
MTGGRGNKNDVVILARETLVGAEIRADEEDSEPSSGQLDRGGPCYRRLPDATVACPKQTNRKRRNQLQREAGAPRQIRTAASTSGG